MKRKTGLIDRGSLVAAAAATAALWVAMCWLSPAQAQSPTLTNLMRQFPLRVDGRPSSIATVGSEYRFTPRLTRKLGSVSWSIVNKPAWARFDISTGMLYGTPQEGHLGLNEDIRISVTDGVTTQQIPAFRLRVVKCLARREVQPLTAQAKPQVAPAAPLAVPMPEVGGTAPAQVQVRQQYVFTPQVQAGAVEGLTFAVIGKPDWASFDSRTGTLSGRPGPLQSGDYPNIRILASNGDSVVQLPAFNVTVVAGARTTVNRSAANPVKARTRA